MSKKLKKFICVLLVALLVTAVPVYAMTATTTVEQKVPLLQEGDFDLPDTDIMSVSFYGIGNVDDLQTYIYNELLNCNPDIRIDNSKYEFKAEEIRDIYCNVINDNPDLFYVSSTYSLSVYRVSKNVAAIKPYYTMSAQEIADAKIVFDKGVEKALSVVDNSMDDMQKALVLHDYVCDLANYEKAGEVSHSAYGFFKDQKIVCAGYSLAYSYLLNKVGVQCEYMSSSKMHHAWNLIKIKGNWYHADLTYDDVYCYNQHENIRGAMKHNFFLKSDEFIKSPQGGCHFAFSSYDSSVATDTSLDNYFWNDVNTYIPVVDGCYYYLDQEPSNYVFLKKRDVYGNERYVNQNLKFSSPSFNLNAAYNDEYGNRHEVASEDMLIRLAYLDNRFYIASNMNLKSVFADGSYYDICSLSNYPVGMGCQNGNIVYQPYQTYSPVIVDKNDYLNEYLMTDDNAPYNNYPDINNDKVINTKDFAMQQNSNYVF